MIKKILYFLGSAHGALILILAVAVCSIVGAISPQEGAASVSDLESWRTLHPVLTRIISPWGGFHIFSSRLFMVVLCLLGMNIISCTILQLFFGETKEKRTRLEMAGFYMLHAALIVVIAGGFISAGWRLDGRIVLIEGQSWTAGSRNYLVLFEAPFRSQKHPVFEITLNKIEQHFEGKNHQIDLKSHFLLPSAGGKTERRIIKINSPFTFKGLTFTQDQVGFAPSLTITRESDKATLLDGFLALKRFPRPEGSEHRDILPMPLGGGSLIVTMFPSAVWSGGVATKTGDAPENPVLKLEYGGHANHPPPVFLKLGSEASIAGYSVRFGDWRYWSMYRISDDPGYPLVCFGLWLGLAAMAIRYGRLLMLWWSGKDQASSVTGVQ